MGTDAQNSAVRLFYKHGPWQAHMIFFPKQEIPKTSTWVLGCGFGDRGHGGMRLSGTPSSAPKSSCGPPAFPSTSCVLPWETGLQGKSYLMMTSLQKALHAWMRSGNVPSRILSPLPAAAGKSPTLSTLKLVTGVLIGNRESSLFTTRAVSA